MTNIMEYDVSIVKKEDEKSIICRVCMELGMGNFYNIFEQNESLLNPDPADNDILIVDKLKACANVRISHDDGLPHTICSSCLLELEHAYNFKKKCEKSDESLRIWSRFSNKQNQISTESCGQDAPIKQEGLQTECTVTPLPETNTEDVSVKPDVFEEDESIDTGELEYYEPKRRKHKNKEHKPDKKEKVKKAKSDNDDLSCKDCTKSFNTMDGLTRHFRKDHKLTCPTCKLQLKTPNHYLRHQRFRTNICINFRKVYVEGEGDTTVYNCKVCNYCNNKRANMISHLITHTENYKHKCNLCNKAFLRSNDLKIHKERNHKVIAEIEKTCHICGEMIKGHAYYFDHMRKHRETGGDQAYQCDLCKKMFKSKGSIKLHMKRHNSSKDYVCDECPASYNTASGLWNHKIKHSDKKRVCKICGFMTKRQQTMKKHQNDHNPSNFGCKYCGKLVNSEAELVEHIKRHEYRPHACDLCGKTYNKRNTLYQHYRKKHKFSTPPPVGREPRHTNTLASTSALHLAISAMIKPNV